MIIAVTLLAIFSFYLLYLCGRINYRLKEAVQYANKINRELDNVRTVVINQNEITTKLTEAVEYLIIRDGAPYMYTGPKGEA